MPDRVEGKVKWWNEKKGYGFIEGLDKKEYFVHYSGILGDGIKNLKEAQKVSFLPTEDPKGLCAKEVNSTV